MTEKTQSGGIPRKTNHAGRKTLEQKLQDNDEPPNQIQIISHKTSSRQAITAAYERDKWKAFQTFCQAQRQQVMKFNSDVLEGQRGAFHFLVGAPPSHHYLLGANPLTSSVHENKLKTMFYGNTIRGGIFN